MTGGFTGYQREIRGAGREMGYLEQQTRAFATTWRYMVAGAGVYGTLSMIKNLGDFQAKLGEISAIATGPGGIPVVGQELDNLGKQLIDVSNRTTQPIGDLEEGVLSLYSTIGNVPENQAADMMETISKTAITAQSSVQDTTQALLGMLNAFGRGTDELPKFADEFFKVIQLSAGMSGGTYAQKLGVLSSSAALGHFSPEQMGALAIGATRSGGSAATNMQYLSQMMMFLMHPVSKEAQSTLAGIGLGENQRNKLGGYGTLKAFLAEVNKRGGVGLSPALAGASDEMLGQIESSGMTASQAGLSGGGTELISKAFGRIQSQRIAAVLSKLLTPEQVAGTENQTLDQYLAQIMAAKGSVNQGNNRAMEYRRIVQASNALHNMGIEIGTLISPLVNPAAHVFSSGVNDFNNQNPWAQRGEAAGAVVGGYAAFRMLRARGMRGSPLRGVGVVGAGLDTLTNTARGETPLKPLYVAVVYSLAGGGPLGFGFGGGKGAGIPNRDLRTVEGEVGMAGAGTTAGRSSPAWMGAFKEMLKFTIFGVAADIGSQQIVNAMGGGGANGWGNYDIPFHIGAHFAHGDARNKIYGAPFMTWLAQHPGQISGKEGAIMGQYAQGGMWSDVAERRLRAVAEKGQLQNAKIVGKAELTVNVDQKDGQGNTKRTTQHVSMDLFPQFSLRPPQEKAKKTRRAN